MENNVRFIMAVHSNMPDAIYTWYLPEKLRKLECAKVGNYAIVRNCRDYALVKIVGFIDTIAANQKICTGVDSNKRVIDIFSAETIEHWRKLYRDAKEDDVDCPSKQPNIDCTLEKDITLMEI